MNDLITVYRARWDALEALALAVGMFALPMGRADTSGGWRLLPQECDDVLAAWGQVLAAPHAAPQPALFDLESEAA